LRKESCGGTSPPSWLLNQWVAEGKFMPNLVCQHRGRLLLLPVDDDGKENSQ
ncbi:unnamed protein product, partial [marine sediment metagenome]